MNEALRWWMEDITTIANSYGLDPQLVAAIVWQESRGHSDAYRFEPAFFLRYLSRKPEWKDKNPRRVSASYGLTQILHVTAYEMGFRGEPEELFLPRTNLHYGCQKLKSLFDWVAGFPVSPDTRLRAAIAAYNGGRGGNTPGKPLRPTNAQYADRVLATLNELHG